MEQGYEQKMYRCTLRYKGSPLHTMALDVTRHELKLLAFVHGNEALPPNEIKYLGKKVVEEVRFVEGKREVHRIQSEMEEMKRLARKYDTLGDHDGINRGRKAVEGCFRVTLDNFEDIFRTVDPRDAAEAAALAAELKAESDARKPDSGLQIEEIDDTPAPEPVQEATQKPPPLGLGDIFKRTANEGVSP